MELEILYKQQEIEEGFLHCNFCHLHFPIVKKIPIMWDDFVSYLSERPSLGGKLMLHSKNQKMKSFLKKTLSQVKKIDNRANIEDRWVKIYQKSTRSRFYSKVKSSLVNLPRAKLVLEHGCSIGTVSEHLSKYNELVFGIDRSFLALSIAKKTSRPNLDYFVADSLSHPFGKQKFELIVALNMLELIEPRQFLKTISQQTSKFLFLSDPYDFDRGIHSVKTPMDSTLLRKELRKNKFSIANQTKKPSFISWNLQINSRATLQYKVDLVVGKKL